MKQITSISRALAITGLMIPLCAGLAVAQSRYSSDFSAWKAEQNRQFSRFLSDQDRAFSAFLEREAKLLDPEEGQEQYVAPKPPDPPVFTPSQDERPEDRPEPEAPGPVLTPPEPPAPEPPRPAPEPRPEPVKPRPTPAPAPAPAPAPRPDRPLIPGPAVPVPTDSRLLRIDFYGRELELRYPRSMAASLSRPVQQQGIADFWETLASSDHDPLVQQIASFRQQLELNDWGYALLIRRIGEAIYPQKPDEATLFAWFILSKSGYATSLSFTPRRTYLLVKSSRKLYGVPYFTFDTRGGTFYLLTLSGSQEFPSGALYTYDQTFPGADRSFDFLLPRAPALAPRPVGRTYTFSYRGDTYSVPVEYDATLVDFLTHYPQLSAEDHFISAPSNRAEASLIRSLTPLIEGRTPADGANLLIRFVQTAFEYETDQDQFNREKLMNPDEILHYNRSDCDDRSIFYTYLVRRLLHLETAGLDYPGHLATAVRFPSPVAGDTVRVEGAGYLVCDPTYINADIGREMPSVRGQLERAFRIRER